MSVLDFLKSGGLSFVELHELSGVSKRELSKLVDDGVIFFSSGKYFLAGFKSSRFDVLLGYKWYIFSLLVFLNFFLLYHIGGINFDYFFGIRDTFFYSQPYLVDFSLYSVEGSVVYLFDSGLFCYVWTYFLLNFFPWGSVGFFALFFSCLFTFVNILLSLSIFRSKWSFIVVPLVFLLMPNFEFPNIFVVSFFLLALKFRSKPYLCAFFGSFAFFFKQFMIVPHLLLILLPYVSSLRRFKFTKVLFFQLLIFFGIPLLVYAPFGLFTVFNAFLSTANSGYEFNQFVFSFFFLVLFFIVIVAVKFFKSFNKDLLLVLLSSIFILFSQFKFGSTFYLGIFSVFFLIVFYNKSINVYDKRFLFVFAFLFLLSFIFVFYSLLLPGLPRMSEISRGSLSFFNDKRVVSVNRMTVHPLWFSRDFAFNRFSIYDGSFNVSDFDVAFFHKHIGFTGELSSFYSQSNCFLLPIPWASCVNCNQAMPVCFNNYSDMIAAFIWFSDYYSKYLDEICALSPLTYSLNYLYSGLSAVFSRPCYNSSPIELFVISFFAYYNFFILVKNVFCVFLIVFYLFKFVKR